ncbi:MAG: hypothetical protein ABI432_16210 [Flavobacteriales bacterium]
MPGILLAIAYTALFLYGMRRIPFFSRVPGLPMRWVAVLFVAKILAGTVLWAVYTYIYTDRLTADVFKYFDDSAVMFNALFDRPLDYLKMVTSIGNDTPYFTEYYYAVMNNWIRQFENNIYNDSHTMIRLNAMLRLFSFGHYHVHTVFACFLSTTGLVGLFRTFAPLLRGLERGLMAGVFLWPSMLFWASGVLKESLLVFGLGLFMIGAIGLPMERHRWRAVLATVIGLSIMLVVKFYVLFCLLPGLIALLWHRRNGGNAILKSAMVHALAVLCVVGSGLILPGYDVLQLLALKQHDFIGMATSVHSGSFVQLPALEPDLWSFVRNVPHALYMTLLSPFAALSNGPLGWASAAENVLLLLAPIVALRYRRPWSEVDKPMLLFCLSFILLLAVLIGLTVPVIGALVRYRIPLLPFISVATLLLIDARRLPRWLPFTSRT